MRAIHNQDELIACRTLLVSGGPVSFLTKTQLSFREFSMKTFQTVWTLHMLELITKFKN
jgi:hypothetical protein